MEKKPESMISSRTDLSHELLLQKADQSVSTAAAAVDQTYRLHYHFMPQAYWMNDPNGLVFFDGYYHVFYQHHPYSPDWGPMHWGHARTKDFLLWEHLPIALAPSEDYDRDGCFSGSAVVDQGALYLFYTGHRVVQGRAIQVQCRAASLDGLTFVKDPLNPLIRQHPPEGSCDFRDPKVWKHGGTWFMALGSGKDGIGRVLLYRSSDLSHWEYVGVFAESDGTQGTIWECPDVFRLGEKHVLVVSPIGREPRRVLYFVGDVDYRSGTFVADYSRELDHGSDFYAAQSFFGTDRRILLAWMDAWDVDIPSKKDNWAGALTLPRELLLGRDGSLRFRPLPELRGLRKDHCFTTNMALDGAEHRFSAFDLQEAGLEIHWQLDLENTTAAQFGILFLDARSFAQFSVGFRRRGEELYVDAGRLGVFSAEVSPTGETRDLRIFVDRSSVEVFADGGAVSITARVYPSSHKLFPTLFAVDGQLRTVRMDLWSLAK